MQKNCGIVLRNYYPYKQKISLFDKEHGRIDATLIKHRSGVLQQLNNGTVLRYTIGEQSTISKIHDVEIMTIPFELAKHDLNFFHHILELSYYFLPPNAAAPDTFDLIMYLFNTAAHTFNKHLILFRFFISLGIYPENIPFKKSYFTHLASQGLEAFFKEKLDEIHHKVLESWLLQCIAMHPYKDHFKTISHEKNIMVTHETI